MALNPRLLEMVRKASINSQALIEARAERRDRRNRAILGYTEDGLDEMEAIDIARDEVDFIQRIESYNADDVRCFGGVVRAYLEGAPIDTLKILEANLSRLHEAVALARDER